MRAPPGPVSCQDQQAGARPFLLHKPHLEKNNAALPPVWGKAHEVGGRKYVDFHRIGRLIRESLPHPYPFSVAKETLALQVRAAALEEYEPEPRTPVTPIHPWRAKSRNPER
jgi:hypothetical protein